MDGALSLIDWVVIGVYLLGVLLVALYVSGKQASTRDYFLGDRQLPWWAVTLSIIATETSAVTFIGLPGAAYRGDWHFLQLVLGFIAGRVFLAFFFVRAFYRFEIITVYGYLERRFGNATRAVAALLFLLGRVVASGVRLYAACLAVQVASGLDMTWAIVGLGLFGVAYTLVGGIRSVVWTDCILGSTFILGGLISIVFLVSQVDGGLSAIGTHEGFHAKLRVIWLGASDTGTSWAKFFASTKPLALGLLGGFVTTLATHGTDQDMVQRMLTCSDARAGAKSLLGSAVILLPMSAMFLLVGSLLWLVHQTNPALQPQGLEHTDHIFPAWIVQHLPIGIAGILFAGVFAAALSSLTSVLNALASTLIEDFYRPFMARGRTEEHYVTASRVATVLAGIALIGVAIAFVGSKKGVFELALQVLGYFYGALLGCFVLGIFTPRGSTATTTLGMLASVPCVLVLQLRAFIAAPELAPDLVRQWLDALPSALKDDIALYVPNLAWPLWIVVGAAVSLGIGALGHQTIVRSRA